MTPAISISKRFSFCGFALLLGGCATVFDRTQIVSIDSPSRNSTFEIDKTMQWYEPLSKQSHFESRTPEFIELPRSRSYKWRLLDGPQETGSGELNCGINYTTSIVGNTILTLGSPYLGLAAFALDIATGSIFDCKDQVILRPKPSVRKQHDKDPFCRKLVVAPVYSLGLDRTDRIIENWRNRFDKLAHGCDSLVDQTQADNIFSALGFDGRHEFDATEVSFLTKATLGKSTDATHVVVFQAGENDSSLTAKVYDLHTGLRAKDFDYIESEGPVSTTTSSSGTSSFSYFAYGLRLIPNAFLFNFYSDSSLVSSKDGSEDPSDSSPYRTENIHDRFSVPKLLSNWEITYVEGPLSTQRWGASFGFKTSVFANYFNQERTITVTSDDRLQKDTYHYEIQLLSLTAPLMGFALFQTPFRINFDIGIGYGPEYMYVSDNEIQRANIFTTAGVIAFGLSMNFSEEYFLRLQALAITPGQTFNSKLFEPSSMTSTTIGIGYYWATFPVKVRKFLTKK